MCGIGCLLLSPVFMVIAFLIFLTTMIMAVLNPLIQAVFKKDSFWCYKSYRDPSLSSRSMFGAEHMVNHYDGDVVPRPIYSYYDRFPASKYGKNAIVVGLHYTNWCPACKRMKPVWDEIKRNLMNSPNDFSGVTMIENDEEKKPTNGVVEYPTILKYRNGKALKYLGPPDYDNLRSWILEPMIVDTQGASW